MKFPIVLTKLMALNPLFELKFFDCLMFLLLNENLDNNN